MERTLTLCEVCGARQFQILVASAVGRCFVTVNALPHILFSWRNSLHDRPQEGRVEEIGVPFPNTAFPKPQSQADFFPFPDASAPRYGRLVRTSSPPAPGRRSESPVSSGGQKGRPAASRTHRENNTPRPIPPSPRRAASRNGGRHTILWYPVSPASPPAGSPAFTAGSAPAVGSVTAGGSATADSPVPAGSSAPVRTASGHQHPFAGSALPQSGRISSPMRNFAKTARNRQPDPARRPPPRSCASPQSRIPPCPRPSPNSPPPLLPKSATLSHPPESTVTVTLDTPDRLTSQWLADPTPRSPPLPPRSPLT